MTDPEEFRKELMKVPEKIGWFLNNKRIKLISFSKISDDEGLNRAIDCAISMRKFNTYEGDKIGVINPDIPEGFGMSNLRRGQIILYVVEEDGTTTVKIPYTQEEISRQRSQGSLITNSVMINVPQNYIRRLVP